MRNLYKKQNGFTLIELLVVIVIIGLLSVIIVFAANRVRRNAYVTKRVTEMRQIQKVLEIYYEQNNVYPTGDGDGVGGFDVGNKTYPLLGTLPISFGNMPEDRDYTGTMSGYFYYRYPAGSYSCGPYAFYVLGFSKEYYNSSLVIPESPGWSCGVRNWTPEFEWVTGQFEAP